MVGNPVRAFEGSLLNSRRMFCVHFAFDQVRNTCTFDTFNYGA